MVKIFILKVIWYLSFFIYKNKYFYNKYLINMNMNFYWSSKIIRKILYKFIFVYQHFKYIYIYIIPYNYGEFYSYILYKLYSIIYYWWNYIYLNYLEIYYVDSNKKLIILINFLLNINIYLKIIFNDYFNLNLLINFGIIKKIKEIEKLFFHFYLKWFNFKDGIKMLTYNIIRFDIDEWKDLDPEVLDRIMLKTKRYWLSFGDQNLLNKLVDELRVLYENDGPRIKMATRRSVRFSRLRPKS